MKCNFEITLPTPPKILKCNLTHDLPLAPVLKLNWLINSYHQLESIILPTTKEKKRVDENVNTRQVVTITRVI